MTRKTNYYSGSINIPSSVTYNSTIYSVTSIGYSAFYNCDSLTSITIPNSVTSIGNYAFYDCTSLTSINIPNSVTSIGEVAFRYCSNLTSITISNSVTSIGEGAFFGCTSLTSINIPNSVISIGDGAFSGCSKLTSINVDAANTHYASIDGVLFNYAKDTLIKCPIGNTRTEYTIPNSVSSIGSSAFSSCSNLASITIPNSVTSIGNYAFYDCTSLTTISIPNSVTSIGDGVFRGCSKLTSLNVDAANTHYASIDGVLFNYTKDTLIQYPIGNTRTAYTIPNSVISIGDEAFNNCSNLTTVTIPNSVTYIGNYAFSYCSKLNSITIPNSVTSIGNFAFYDCSNLTSITIPNSVTSIGIYAFYGCDSLTSVTIGNSVTSIGEGAFRDCTSLTSINIPNSVISIGDEAFSGCTSLPVENDLRYADTYLVEAVDKSKSTYTIKNDTKWIGRFAFLDCSPLTSITIPNSVTSIGKSAFEGCSNLTSITCYAIAPPTCGTACFYDVNKAIPIYVPGRSITTYQATKGWNNFTNIQTKDPKYTLTLLGDENIHSFIGAGTYYDSTQVEISATAKPYYQFSNWSDGNTDNPRTITLTQDTTLTAIATKMTTGSCGDDLTWHYSNGTLSINGSSAMYDYTQTSVPWFLFRDSFTNIVIEKGATSIGKYAFYGCSNKNLKSIILPNSILTIGEYAFAECSWLKEITFGTELEEIGDNAFANDQRLIYITCYAEEPPLLATSAFNNYDAYLYVPCSANAEYKVATGWKLFNKDNITCISAETTSTSEVVVVPGDNTATITWPTTSDANTYTIVIEKDDEVFCTLTFNADDQLTNIAFAPGRGMNNSASAIEVAGGYRFTVTGLDSSTKYDYEIDTRNAGGTSLANYTGTFTTTGGTALDQIPFPLFEDQGEAAKYIKDGQLLILRDGKTYNAPCPKNVHLTVT